jgi:hypothetical protein
MSLPDAAVTAGTASQLVVGGAIAVIGTWATYKLFVSRELFLAWIVPLFLLGMPVAAFAFAGSAHAIGALIGLIAGAATLGVRSWQLMRAHRGKLAALARELGLSYSHRDERPAADAATLTGEFGSCVNVLRGMWRGMPVCVFDYQYLDTSDSEAPAAIILTCVATELDGPRPLMIIRGHRLKEALRQRFGSKRGFLGDEAFDRRFRVETADLEQAKAALSRRTRDWLVANASGDRVLVNGTTLMLCSGHQTMTNIPALLERIVSLRATFPEGRIVMKEPDVDVLA